MELKRIAINKEVIIRKLPSNKYITREITKMTKRTVQQMKVKVLQNGQIYQQKTLSIKKRL